MSSKEVFDRNSLYCYTGYLNQEQISKLIKDCINQISLSKNIDQRFIVNTVCNKYNVPLRFSYVYFYSPEIRNVFLGKNLDGSERVEYVSPAVDDWSDLPANWADIEDDKELQITLPPLITIEPIIYTPEQIKLSDKNDGYDFYDKDKGYLINFSPAKATKHHEDPEFDDKYHNILTGKVPVWATDKMLKEHFEVFNHDHNTHSKRYKGETINFKYPDIQTFIRNIVDRKTGKEIVEKICTVVFNPESSDAQFAMNFRFKSVLINPSNKEETIVYMSYKKRSMN